MAAKANRRRTRPSSVKVAFGDNDNEDEKQDLSDEYSPTTPNQAPDNNGELNRSYQQAFFTINNTTVEVILENDILSWSTVTNESQNDASRRKNGNSVNLENVYAITPIHSYWNWSSNTIENIAGTTVSTANTLTSSAAPPPPSSNVSDTSILRGFQLHSYQIMPENIFQEILIIFQSNEPNQVERWFHFLSKIISENNPSRHIFVICHPYAGARRGRNTYNTKIKPIFHSANYKITYTEIDEQCSADEVVKEFENELDSIDSFVIIGGDGSVINVINALIRYFAKQTRTRLDTEHDLPSIPFPLCIIPEGTTNIISHTIHGNTDPCTPVLHLIFNQKMKIDMSAIFDVDYHFVTANFSSGAGYPATILQYFPRYHLHPPRRVIKKSFAKATAHKNLKPIEMEIRYVPAQQNEIVVGRCYRGCPSCTPPAAEKSDDIVKAFDDSHVHKMQRQRKTSASTNGTNHRLSSAGKTPNEKDKNWKVLHQEYLQVAVFTNAALWSFAPQGLAKFGHLADGLLDLIVIEPVGKKEFLRYIKRNGNSKNQCELAFTRLIKVKEIEIELKVPNDISYTDNPFDSSQSDDSSNENMSDNEANVSGVEKHQPHPPSAPISDESLRNRQRRRRINQQVQDSPQPVLHSSKSMDATMLQSKPPRQQQSESELDSPQPDGHGSPTSVRRSGIFQSFKSKKEKTNLPRTASARGRETDDEKQQQRKSRRSFRGTLRPARSLLSLLSGGNSSSSKPDNASTFPTRDSFSGNNGRRPSIISRSSSLTDTRKKSSRKVKVPCLWNLDFTAYNSPLIRIKCFYRYLTVYGTSIDPDTKIKEVTYSCF